MSSTTPSPGRPVRGSPSGRPVMALLDRLGRRGTLRLLWELRDGKGQSFRTLRASVVELGESGYALTAPGRELVRLLKPLNRWAEDWPAGRG